MLSTNLRARAIQRLAGHLMTRPIPALRMHDVPRRTLTLHVRTRRGTVRCTVYSPPEAVAGPPPVYVNLHGGGFVIRHPEADDHICRYLAAAVGCVVVNVDYDVAPQRPFPAASTQTYDAVQWVADHAAEQGWDGSQLAVGGQSAGGNLAAGSPSLPVTPERLLLPSRSCSTRPSTSPSIRGRSAPAPTSRCSLPGWAGSSTPPTSPTQPSAPTPWCRPSGPLTSLGWPRPWWSPPSSTCCATRPTPTPRRSPTRACPSATTWSRASHHAFTHRGPAQAANDTFAVVSDALRAAFAETAPTTPSPGTSR